MKELTKRQALFLFVICLLANKVQRLPSFISSSLGRHGWLFFLIMGVVDILFLLLVLYFNKLAHDKTTYQVCEKAGGKWYAKTIFIVLTVYFLANAILPFEAVHDLFGNILFDHLSWELYSLILVFTVGVLARLGIRNIGRTSELYFYIITISFIILIILGATTTSFYRTLPIADINFRKLFETCFEYNIWFGDFIIIYIFVGKVKQDDGKLGWPFIVCAALCTLVLSFVYTIFYGLYQNLSVNQYSLISSISQFALLGLDIGRVDWFLVLLFQISTVISSALYIFASSSCLKKVLGLKNNHYIIFVFLLILYILDVFVFKSIQEGATVFAAVSKYFGFFVVTLLPIILIITALVFKKKQAIEKSRLPQNIKKFCFLVKETNAQPIYNISKKLEKKFESVGKKRPSKKEGV